LAFFVLKVQIFSAMQSLLQVLSIDGISGGGDVRGGSGMGCGSSVG
jgi:hypothetical protein